MEPCTDTYDAMSMDSWPTRQPSSHIAADIDNSDMHYTTSGFGRPENSWRAMNSQHDYDQAQNMTTCQERHEKKGRQVVVTLRDDQLGQIVRTVQ
jgi:hypothetical protein